MVRKLQIKATKLRKVANKCNKVAKSCFQKLLYKFNRFIFLKKDIIKFLKTLYMNE